MKQTRIQIYVLSIILSLELVVGVQYYQKPVGSPACPESDKIRSVQECRKAIKALGLVVLHGEYVGSTKEIPSGCSWQNPAGGVHWNSHPNGQPRGNQAPICRQRSKEYYQKPLGSPACPASDKIRSLQECRKAISALGLVVVHGEYNGSTGEIPSGCSWQTPAGGVHWNRHPNGQPRGNQAPICRRMKPNPPPSNVQYYKKPLGSSSCPASDKLTSLQECKNAISVLGLVSIRGVYDGSTAEIPSGCSWQTPAGGPHWNTHPNGQPRGNQVPICRRLLSKPSKPTKGPTIPTGTVIKKNHICKVALNFLLFKPDGLDPDKCRNFILNNPSACPSNTYQISSPNIQWAGCKCCTDTTLVQHPSYTVYIIKGNKPTSQCKDTASWTNGKGNTCQDYAQPWMYCENRGFKAGKEWTAGSYFNHPEKNCCACGKGKSSPQWMDCKNTANWKNAWGDCSSYAKLYCKNGLLVDQSKGGAHNNNPSMNCCVCGGGKNIVAESGWSLTSSVIAGSLFFTFFGLTLHKLRKKYVDNDTQYQLV